MTQSKSSRAAWMAPWMMKPVSLTSASGGPSTTDPSALILSRLKMVLRPRHAHGDVIVDQIIPAKLIGEPVGRREFDAQFGFR
jgi:hypothetical protein